MDYNTLIAMESWIDIPSDSDFPIQNIPFGIATFPEGKTAAASRIGDYVVDLDGLGKDRMFSETSLDVSTLGESTLNSFIAQGKQVTNSVRERLMELFNRDGEKAFSAAVKKHLYPLSKVEMRLPVRIGDYTDFYSSKEHATNVGTMFRDPDNALLPNWLHLPVGYHGRASSIVVSGTGIRRPNGQQLPAESETPVFGPTKLLDFELEMGFVVGSKTELGDNIPVDEAEDSIFGLFLFNDWSARDIQKWEHVPLGPFLAKSFASTVSPWIVTTEALEPFRVAGPDQDPEPLPYLKSDGKYNFDINLMVELITEKGDRKIICNSNFKYMYWNMAQQLAHHTINGCNFNVGDVCASGTISGPTEDSYGSMLELTWRGSKPIQMPDGTERKFIEDGDTVVLRGYGEKDGLRIGFGEASGRVLPAKSM